MTTEPTHQEDRKCVSCKSVMRYADNHWYCDECSCDWTYFVDSTRETPVKTDETSQRKVDR